MVAWPRAAPAIGGPDEKVRGLGKEGSWIKWWQAAAYMDYRDSITFFVSYFRFRDSFFYHHRAPGSETPTGRAALMVSAFVHAQPGDLGAAPPQRHVLARVPLPLQLVPRAGPPADTW